MVKRFPPSDSGNSSEYELKPDISDDENDFEAQDINQSKKKIPIKKSKKSPIKAGPREAPRKWTPVEDEIFLEIMSKVVKARMWDAVKDDGRLGYRGAPGIAAHLTAIMNKFKKSWG